MINMLMRLINRNTIPEHFSSFLTVSFHTCGRLQYNFKLISQINVLK